MLTQGKILRDVLVMNMGSQLDEISVERYGKEVSQLMADEAYITVLCFVKRLVESFGMVKGEKKLYYISPYFEKRVFLMNNLCNLGIYEMLKNVLEEKGQSLDALVNVEQNYLGTQNLYGKTAEVFLDAMTATGLPGEAIGIRTIRNYEERNEEAVAWERDKSWLEKENVKFQLMFKEIKAQTVLYSIDVAGKNKEVYKYWVFDLEIEEKILEDKEIYYNYFLVSSAVRLILMQMREKKYDLRKLDSYAAIRFDHETVALLIPELVRILVEEKAVPFKEAAEIVKKTCGYDDYASMLEAVRNCPKEYVELLVSDFISRVEVLN